MTMATVCMAAFILYFSWVFWRGEPIVTAPTRSFGDVTIDWLCESGHSFQATGQTDSRSCPQCSKRSYVVTLYQCEVHGRMEIMLGYDAEQDDVRVTRWRLPSRGWVTSEEKLRCPRCRRALRRAPRDPLAPIGRKIKTRTTD